MKNQLTLMVLVFASLAFAASAFAEDGKTGVCAADVKKHCASVDPGQGRVWECLSGHTAELEAACKAHVEVATQRHAAWDAACAVDVTKHCASVTGSKGHEHRRALHQCLSSHTADLAPACQAMLADHQAAREVHKAQREAFKAACMEDIKSLCGGKGKGKGKRGEIAACLAENDAKLSQPCKDARANLDPDDAADAVAPPEDAAPPAP